MFDWGTPHRPGRSFGSVAAIAALMFTACQPAAPTTTGSAPAAPTAGATAPAAPAQPTAPAAKTIVPITPGPKIAGGPVKIGFISSLTGPIADSSTANRRGFELAIDDWNAAGGFGGEKVQGIVYDDEFKPQRAVELTQRLISVDKVAALVGYNFGGAALASIDIAQQAKIPMMVTGSGVSEVTGRYAKESPNYIYGVRMNDLLQARVAFTFMKDKRGQDLKKIAILHDTTAYGVQGKEDGTTILKDMGIAQACAVEVVNPGDKDTTSQIQKVEAAGCDAVIVYMFPPETTAVLQSARKVNSKIKFFGNWGWSQPALYQIAGEELLKGVPFVQSFTVDHSPEAKELDARLKEKYKESLFPLNSAQGYDGTMLLLRAIAKAGSTGPAKIIEALESTTGFKGTTKISATPFSKTNHDGLDKVDMYFMGEWKNGAVVTAQ